MQQTPDPAVVALSEAQVPAQQQKNIFQVCMLTSQFSPNNSSTLPYQHCFRKLCKCAIELCISYPYAGSV